jgi:hypothetical protein
MSAVLKRSAQAVLELQLFESVCGEICLFAPKDLASEGRRGQPKE